MMKEAAEHVESVSPRDARKQASRGAVLVDVRSTEEFQNGSIGGSVSANRGSLEFFADPTFPTHKSELDPSSRIIVVCRSGARAVLAARTLQEMGFEDVAVMAGGLVAWKEAGLPTVEHESSMI
jgi:rhodanese-related sulfurtransferase